MSNMSFKMSNFGFRHFVDPWVSGFLSSSKVDLCFQSFKNRCVTRILYNMSTTFIGTGIGVTEEYGIYEERIHILLKQQIEKKFPNDENLLISTTWFGPTFNHHNDNWEKIINNTTKYHNVLLISEAS